MTQKEKNYLFDVVKSWIKNRNELVQKNGIKPLDIKSQFVAYKILIDKDLVEVLKNVNNGKSKYFLNHTGFNSKVEVKDCDKSELTR